MQVFLPYISFIETAKCLDYKRLGKQRVEAMQILRILTGVTPQSKWRNHPCVKQWEGYEDALKLYHDIMIYEWVSRGYKNTMPSYILDLNLDEFDLRYVISKKHIDHYVCDVDSKITYTAVIPSWLDDNFCSYHRSTLLFKNPEWYGKFGWTEEPKYEYF